MPDNRVWLYHKKEAPNGTLFEGRTDGELADLKGKGWKDSPAGFNPDPQVDTNDPSPAVSPAQVTLLTFDSLSDGEIVTKIDDMSRAELEAYIEAHSIDRGEAQTTSELRGALLMAIRPEAINSAHNVDTPPVTPPSVQEPAKLGVGNLDTMDHDARLAAIDGFDEEQLKAGLTAVGVSYRANASEDSLRKALKSFYNA